MTETVTPQWLLKYLSRDLARLQRLEADNEAQADEIACLKQELEDARTAEDMITSSEQGCLETITTLRARIAVLEAALRPFADEGRKWTGTDPRHDALTLLIAPDPVHLRIRAAETQFTIGQLKAAHAALNGEKI